MNGDDRPKQAPPLPGTSDGKGWEESDAYTRGREPCHRLHMDTYCRLCGWRYRKEVRP